MARILESVRSKGFQNQLTSMGTIVETNTLTEALSVIEDAYKELEPDCERVYVTVNIDIRKGELGRIDSKIQSVEEKIAHSKNNS